MTISFLENLARRNNMKVKDFIKELKRYPQDAEVYVVGDWEKYDEFGNLSDLMPVYDVSSQNVVIETGMDFEDVTEVLIEVREAE